jgi:hypothetical protein
MLHRNPEDQSPDPPKTVDTYFYAHNIPSFIWFEFLIPERQKELKIEN